MKKTRFPFGWLTAVIVCMMFGIGLWLYMTKPHAVLGRELPQRALQMQIAFRRAIAMILTAIGVWHLILTSIIWCFRRTVPVWKNDLTAILLTFGLLLLLLLLGKDSANLRGESEIGAELQ